MMSQQVKFDSRSPRAGASLAAAFTLIELLVVISIISLLIAIRDSARRIQCQSSMRQIGLSVVMYRGEYNQWFPPHRITQDGFWPNPLPFKQYRFDQLLHPYLGFSWQGPTNVYNIGTGYFSKPGNFMVCPGNPNINQRLDNATNFRKWFYWDASSVGNYHTTRYFGFDNSSFTEPPVRLDPSRPSKVLLSHETFGINKGTVTSTIQFHPGETSNFLLVDGHVITSGAKTNAALTAAGIDYWN